MQWRLEWTDLPDVVCRSAQTGSFRPSFTAAWAARQWMNWRASYGLLKTPLTGLGAEVDPDFNISSDSVSTSARTGGPAPHYLA